MGRSPTSNFWGTVPPVLPRSPPLPMSFTVAYIHLLYSYSSVGYNVITIRPTLYMFKVSKFYFIYHLRRVSYSFQASLEGSKVQLRLSSRCLFFSLFSFYYNFIRPSCSRASTLSIHHSFHPLRCPSVGFLDKHRLFLSMCGLSKMSQPEEFG